MGAYSYKARTKSGQVKSGEIQADSKSRAYEKIRNIGLKPLSVNEASSGGNGGSSSGFIYRDKHGQIQIALGSELPNSKELSVFTKQLSVMIENGIPLIQALGLLKEQQKKRGFEEVLGKVIRAVENGASLTDALSAHPKVFDSLYLALAEAGETSGRLDVIMKQLVKYIEKAVKIKGQVKSAMAYPAIVISVAVIIVVLLLTFVVPTFAAQFEQSGQELPFPTVVVLALSDALAQNWHVLLGGLIVFFYAFNYWRKTVKGKIIVDKYILKLPILGEVLTKIAVGRFCSTLSTLLGSGVSIMKSLSICATSSGNSAIETIIEGIKSEIEQGSNFADPLAEAKIFPKMVSSMVAVGEATGTLDQTLAKVTDIYEDEVDNSIAAMTSMIEPLLIVVLGVVVGFILLAMYLPIFDMAGTLG